MGVLPVDMLTPLPEPEKPQDKPKPNEKELFAVPKKEESEPTNEVVPMSGEAPVKQVKKPRGKSKDPEHLKKMREASALRRAERKKEKEEAELIIAEAKLLKEQQLAKKMTTPPVSSFSSSPFDYDKLAEAIEKRKKSVPKTESMPSPASAPRQEIGLQPKPAPTIDYKKKYEQTQIQLFEEKVRADERKRIATERQTKINNVARNNMRVPKALQKYQERANQYAEQNKNNPWDSFFK